MKINGGTGPDTGSISGVTIAVVAAAGGKNNSWLY